MTVYDCFMFHDEFDVLEMRMNILEPYVDRFVLVQSNRTFPGGYKSLASFDEPRFERFRAKLIICSIDSSGYTGPWCIGYEHFMRDATKDILVRSGCTEEDIIILGDMDEIPNLERLFKTRVWPSPISLETTFYYYYLNCRLHLPWNRIKMFRFGQFKDVPFSTVRQADFPTVSNMGWHFSYLGGPEKIREKVNSGSHSDLLNSRFTDIEHIKKCMNEPSDIFERGYTLDFVRLDDSYPKHILDNSNKYRTLGWIKEGRP